MAVSAKAASLDAPVLQALRLATLAAAVLAAPLPGQSADLRLEATAGSDAEQYLRVLQVSGRAPPYPWSLRAFSPAELDRLAGREAAHPWAARAVRDSAPGAVRLRALRPGVGLVFNATAPDGGNDGPVWAGRGLTAVASAGVSLRAGPLSLRVEPQAFWAQNQEFALMDNGREGRLRFADPQAPGGIDAPQRFGDRPYARLDPGQSTLRLDVLGLAAGLSTANQQWGPGDEYPLVLGTNAGGFLHAFAGTSTPWNLGIGRVHGRVIWGAAEQSAYSPAQGQGRRLVTGVVGVLVPFGLDGLEVGGSRFFHTTWPAGGLSAGHLLQPFQAFLKAGLDSTGVGSDQRSSPDNQVASVFARWVLPGSGAEFWGEYLRNDHNWDALDFVLEPDHSSGYALGGRKVWERGGRLLSLRAEWLDTQPSHLLLTGRWQGVMYSHSRSRQGHTHRGQILGSPAAFGGGGGTLALDVFHGAGRWSVDLARTRVRGPVSREMSPDEKVDVSHSLGGEALLFRPGFDLLLRVRASYEMNRHYAGDAVNASAAVGGRIGF